MHGDVYMIFISLLLPVYNSSSDLFEDFYLHKLLDYSKVLLVIYLLPYNSPFYHDKPHVTSAMFP